MKLHWALGSQPGRAVKTVIDIGKIPCTLTQVDIFQRQQRNKEYLQMYPAGKIPVLQDGNFTLGESGAIMTYLCEKNPHVGYLIGESLQERATINQYVSWYQNYFRPAMFKPIRMYLGGVLMGQKILQAHKDSLFGQMFEAIKKLQEILALHPRKYLCGDKLSIADLLFFYELTNLTYFGLSHNQYPEIKRWFAEVYRVPEVKAITHEWYQLAKAMSGMFENVEIVKAKL